jgi:hypothetical protein
MKKIIRNIIIKAIQASRPRVFFFEDVSIDEHQFSFAPIHYDKNIIRYKPEIGEMVLLDHSWDFYGKVTHIIHRYHEGVVEVYVRRGGNR